MQPSPAEDSYWNNYNQNDRHGKSRGENNYDQNDGRPGVVYILANDAFPHLLKVGQSTRSASVRARELNENCGTENPGRFAVLHEVRTVDCGRAEKRAHKKLKKHRFRKEYFKIDATTALKVVQEACAFFNNQQDEQEKARDAKRAADEVKREAEAAAQAKQQADAERAKLTKEEEAAVHAQLLEAVAEFRAASPHEEGSKSSKPASPPAEGVRNTPLNPVTYSTQTSAIHKIINCPKCTHLFPVLTKYGVILTCPACRYSFERTADGRLFDHTNQIDNAPVPAKADVSWWAYAAAVFVVWGGYAAMSGRGDSNQVAESASLPNSSAEEQRLLADIEQYVTSYRISPPEPRSETELRAVERSGKRIQFKYITTTRGERALGKEMDHQHIEDGMRTLACAKPDLKALMQRGALVQYQLHRKGQDAFTVTIVCK